MSSGVQGAVSLRVRAGGVRERSDAMALEQARVGLIGRLRAREREIEDAIYARVSGMFTQGSGEDADYQAGLRETVAAAITLSLSEIEDPDGPPAPIPSVAIAQARRAARRNISVDTLMLRYLGGHRVLGAFVMDEAHRCGLSSNGPALRHLRTSQEAVLERMMTAVADEHRQERERIERSREECHAELVQRLLAGERPDTSELDYELDDAWHLGIIASGARVHRVVRDLAGEMAAPALGGVNRGKLGVGLDRRVTSPGHGARRADPGSREVRRCLTRAGGAAGGAVRLAPHPSGSAGRTAGGDA